MMAYYLRPVSQEDAKNDALAFGCLSWACAWSFLLGVTGPRVNWWVTVPSALLLVAALRCWARARKFWLAFPRKMGYAQPSGQQGRRTRSET